jgi:hypothetical protein
MGWTGFIKPLAGSRKDWLIKEFDQENDTYKWYLTDVSMRGNTAYCISWCENKATGQLDHEGMVILTSIDGDWFNYKEMGETVEPYYYDAPKKLLDKLDSLGTPKNDNAKVWREKCRKQALTEKKMLIDGQIVKFSEPLNFRSFKEDTFTYVKERGRTVFLTRTGTRCQITNWKKRDYQVIANVNDILKDYHKEYGHGSI